VFGGGVGEVDFFGAELDLHRNNRRGYE
jgi:hypothetical protein